MTSQALLDSANEMKERAYVPYSEFPVGAALITGSENIYTGCNIENAAYPLCCCAERVAIFKAISNGEYTFKEMAVAADTDRPVPPCGSCRQVMNEFFDRNTVIYLINAHNEMKSVTIDDLLPFSFRSDDMDN